MPDHVLADAGLTDVDAQLQKFAVNVRSAPEWIFAVSMRINSRTSLGTAGRPGLPCRIFQRQNKPKPLRCQPITVAGWMMKTRASQSFQAEQSQAQRKRSVG